MAKVSEQRTMIEPRTPCETKKDWAERSKGKPVCDMCELAFKYRVDLRRHRLEKHPANVK